MNAQELILGAGLRTTKARLAVLSTIVDAQYALSHSEILERLSAQKEFDRVTIYRVLDWLTENQIVHKISGDNRAWKFQLSRTTFQTVSTQTNTKQLIENNHQHAHLYCIVCEKITCVHELEPHFPAEVLKTYQVSAIEVNIKGICIACASSAKNSI
jgi:Fur family transcriptional regulator, ferric uptake regulator